MVDISAEWQEEQGRVHITLTDMINGVPHIIERSTDGGTTWEQVRGYSNVTSSSILIYDWEYSPNVENCYRVRSPEIYDIFDRTETNGWGEATTGQTWTPLFDDIDAFSVDDGIGVIETPPHATPSDERIRVEQVLSDVDATITVTVPDVVTDANWETNLGVRNTETTDPTISGYDATFVHRSIDNIVRLRIGRWDTGVFTPLTPLIDIGEFTPGEWWQIRLRAKGNVISARAWIWDTPEPTSWQVSTIDDTYTSGNIDIRNRQSGEAIGYTSYWWGLSVFDLAATWPQACVTPTQENVWIKSIAFPSLNVNVRCVLTSERQRRSRAGIFDVIGRPEPVGVVDVGSTETFTITFVSRSSALNRQIVEMLTWGQPLYLQPPNLDSDEGCGPISGTPGGFVIPGDSVQSHALPGSRGWFWVIPMTRVAAADYAGVVPRQMTWRVLWSMAETWNDVWAMWDTWSEVWSAEVGPEQMALALPPSGGF